MLILFGRTALLIIRSLSCGALVDRLFGPDTRETPAMCMADGVDYVPMSKWKIFCPSY
jgi:carbon starvation protein CstA